MTVARQVAAAALLLLLRPGVAAPPDTEEPIAGGDLLADVRWLADDDRAGRAAGSPGALAAAEFLAERLAGLGLLPAGTGEGFFQEFALPKGFEVHAGTAVVAARDDKTVSLQLERDFQPQSVSAPGKVSAPACFCGYGIAAPELGYDDYAGVDVKGKVVLVLRHAPAQDDRRSPFATPAAQQRYASFRAKAATAAGAGAAALLILNDPENTRNPKDDEVVRDVGGNPGTIPVFHVTYRAGRRLAQLGRLSLQREQALIDRSREPRSRDLEGLTVTVNADLQAKSLPVRNVCARLAAPGAAEGPRETLVVGAHFDHIGMGEYGSRAGSKGRDTVHNGADDNASGSAVALALAGWLAARRDVLRRDVLFVWFTAEELGLLGSKHFVDNCPVPLAQCIAMINLDMVGRLKRGRLQVGGTGTSPVFPDLVEDLARRHRIQVRCSPGGRAPSDNSSFYEKGMPVLFLFTGLHNDYHRPDDDWNRIDRRGMEKVARFAADLCLDLATRPTRPPFTRADAGGMQVGPHLGISLEQRADGVYVIHVESRSPAAAARIDVGDKVEEFDDKPVETMTDFNDLHAATKPGQKVRITLRRGARLLTVTVRLGDA